MSAAAVWCVTGLVIAALELLAPGVFLLWIGCAALGTGAATALADLDWHQQVGVFVGVTVALIGLAALRLRRARTPDLVNAPNAGLIGQACRAIAFQDGEGRVSLRDGTWNARIAGTHHPEPGQALVVTGLDGTTLLVAAKINQ